MTYEEARKQLSRVIDELLTELSKREGVPKPRWMWGVGDAYYREIRLIMIDWSYLLFYTEFPQKTIKLLKYEVAHEFKHYLDHLKGEYYYIALGEILADEYAEKVSGIDAEEASLLYRELEARTVTRLLE